MAEYWILGVDHEKATSPRGPIVHVLYASPSEGGKTWSPFSAGAEATRGQVLKWLKDGARVYTATRDRRHQKIWDRGGCVEATADGKHITTRGNETTSDNLGALPSIAEARRDLG